MFPSPQVDFGYDISDYQNVDLQYGTLADFDLLVAEAKARNIRIILDMVLNHTSDKHQWFIDAASSRTNPKHDWYVWSDGKPGHRRSPNAHEGRVPPNNWISLFGGSAWQWVPAVHQFYYHKFYKQQPDLNWRNPAVEKAMFGAMQFWLDRGVAGFRLDAIPTLFEDPQLRDEPVAAPGLNAQGDPDSATSTPTVSPRSTASSAACAPWSINIPATASSSAKPISPTPPRCSPGTEPPPIPSFSSPWTCSSASTPKAAAPTAPTSASSLPHFRQTLTEMETGLGTNQPLLVFDNHDNPRSWDRFGDGAHNQQIARHHRHHALHHPRHRLMYYGEELGMTTETPTRKEDVKDPIGITGWPKEKGRDGERTPMQWTAGPQAGFSTNSHTWLPIPADAKTINVATETADPNSLLNWNKQPHRHAPQPSRAAQRRHRHARHRQPQRPQLRPHRPHRRAPHLHLAQLDRAAANHPPRPEARRHHLHHRKDPAHRRPIAQRNKIPDQRHAATLHITRHRSAVANHFPESLKYAAYASIDQRLARNSRDAQVRAQANRAASERCETQCAS